MKRLIAFLLIACMIGCMFVATVFATEETEAAVEETTAAEEVATEDATVAEDIAAAEESVPVDVIAENVPAEAEESEGPGALRIILLVMQILACVVLTVVVMLQSSKEGGLGALAGNSGNYFGKGKSATLDGKLASITKWIAAAFVLLTLIVSLLYTAA